VVARRAARPPVLLLHGAFCTASAFDAFREPLEAAGFATHAPTLPHHGPGADLAALARLGLKDYAKFVAAEARALPQPAILIGHSLGALIGQIVATRMPLSALVLLAPSSPWGVWPTTLDEHGAAFGLAMLGDYWARAVPPDFRVARAATLDRLTSDEAKRVFAEWTPESGRALMESIHWQVDASMASSAPAYRIGAPILALAGGRDSINPASTVRRIAARFPVGQASFHEFPEMSHWLVGEPGSENVARLTLAWLDALLEEGPPVRRAPAEARF